MHVIKNKKILQGKLFFVSLMNEKVNNFNNPAKSKKTEDD